MTNVVDTLKAARQAVKQPCKRCGSSGMGGRCASWCPLTPGEELAEARSAVIDAQVERAAIRRSCSEAGSWSHLTSERS